MKQMITVLGVALVASVTLMGSASAGTTAAPTVEFIAASLTDQLQRGAIKVTFTYTDSHGTVQMKYVRSEAIQYVNTALFGLPAWSFLDLKRGITKEFRRSEHSSNLVGTISDNRLGIPTRFTSAMLPDPLLFWVARDTLVNSVSRGIVSSTPEDVDGQMCWKISMKGIKPFESMAYSAWFDPGTAFLPRKVVVMPPHFPESTITFSDYKSIGNGIWFPMKTVKVVTVNGEVQTTEINIVDAEIAGADALAAIDTSFPSGTEVTDDVLNAEYTVP